MLEPQELFLLHDALRPPHGYSVDHALATTFTLDLLALLTAPIALARFDLETDGERPDPLVVLESLRRCGDRITIFCQAGQIKIPAEQHLLYAALEASVIQVKPRKPRALFHPKVWVLRYTAPDGPVRYRVLCLSRNLTFDRSWDTLLALDGELVNRTRAFSANHPLGDFIAALPGLALPPVPPPVRSKVKQIEQELRRVRFELPEGFSDYAFWPLGIDRAQRWPFEGLDDRLLVVSPFVSEGCLKQLAVRGPKHVLVSRAEELDRIPRRALKLYHKVYVLGAGTDPEEEDQEPLPRGDTASLVGLHAKVYVADWGKHARVWTGSANATNAAFNGNVEFLVELRGGRSRCGVDAILSTSKDKTGLLDLLEEYPIDAEPPERDLEQEFLDDQVNHAALRLAEAGLVATVEPDARSERFAVRLGRRQRKPPELPGGVTVRCWPITLKQDPAAVTLNLTADVVAEFPELSLEALTAFFAFEAVARVKGREGVGRFVLKLPLEGVPEDRQDRVFRAVLRDRSQVLRLLLLLLADDGVPLGSLGIGTGQGDGDALVTGATHLSFPLFETLMRVLGRDPAKLDQVADLIRRLSASDEGAQLLPEGFETIWEPIWAARQALRDEARPVSR